MDLLKFKDSKKINCSMYNNKIIFTEEIISDYIWQIDIANYKDGGIKHDKIEGFEKILTILEGNTIISIDEERAERLGPLAKVRVDGGSNLTTFGEIKAYTLTSKKENASTVEVIHVKDKENITIDKISGFKKGVVIIYCLSGFGVFSKEDRKEAIKQGEQIGISFEDYQLDELSILGDGTFLLSIIYFDKKEKKIYEDNPKENIVLYKSEKTQELSEIKELTENNKVVEEEFIAKSPYREGKVQDFLFALKISALSTRGRWVRESKNDDIVYSKLMKKKIRKIKNSYITFLISILGLVGVVALGEMVIGQNTIIPLAIAWIAISTFGIGPLIYYKVIPKPVCKHVIHIESLTKENIDEYATSDLKGDRTKWLLKKYKNSGKEVKHWDNDED